MQAEQLISTMLDRVAAEEQVRILYACESGSRAWGFPSQDSDYDVRFLYVHPRDWYLSIEPGRDVIERPLIDNIDLSGWDLRKALGLLRKSNPPLIEWLSSPIVYRDDEHTAVALRAVLSGVYSPKASMYHYRHMAEGNNRTYLQGDQIWTKKYLYVLRPLLAVRWIERGYGPVPMAFDHLLERTIDDPYLREEIDALVVRKRAGDELAQGPRSEIISTFIDGEITRLASLTVPGLQAAPPTDLLDRIFLDTLARVWS